jgi:hypothetical protein
VKSLAHTELRGNGASRREVLVSVRENRLSGLSIHVLIALSIFLLPLIQLIPMAVLFGLFLYMGIAILQGNQLWERVTLMATDPALYPDTHFVRHVGHLKLHAFTAVQVAALAGLWLLKTSPAGILFPVLIALLVPLRLSLGRFFTPAELAALDGEKSSEDLEGVIKIDGAHEDETPAAVGAQTRRGVSSSCPPR